MGMYIRVGLAGVAACGVLVAAVTVGRGGDGGASMAVELPKGPYVALGDSYTAEPGIPDRAGQPPGCDRSDRNYPAVVAGELGLRKADFRDVSCGGATIGDLTAPQSTDDGVNAAQLSALSSRTGLVTLGIGGNDIGFASTVTSCVVAGARHLLVDGDEPGADDAPCRATYVSGRADEVETKIRATGTRLSGALDEIGRRAPKARVYVVGYPAILPADGTGCARRMSLAKGDAHFLHEKEQQLNAMLRQRAEAAGATYVDTYTPSVGRDACAGPDTRWVEPLVPQAPAASVHPNERGERGMAQAVLRAIGTRG
ncbi:SGNH/GDSL hydrolase family protein [Streptomyces sp. Qhu-G9]|uniref:SGNH/GDSL hydrolase family protein n=1 Tax=Streptomyces sp. Qhu-G9 TaxID=3452799 RepID=UPI0022AC0535|nr:SGNH/GDSL hydrolase family protein [Streptomyces aurantiacus]WAU78724.1 SGNH/GDSL hydrolase family protein [Streptomyces aurantiacus]